MLGEINPSCKAKCIGEKETSPPMSSNIWNKRSIWRGWFEKIKFSKLFSCRDSKSVFNKSKFLLKLGWGVKSKWILSCVLK